MQITLCIHPLLPSLHSLRQPGMMAHISLFLPLSTSTGCFVLLWVLLHLKGQIWGILIRKHICCSLLEPNIYNWEIVLTSEEWLRDRKTNCDFKFSQKKKSKQGKMSIFFWGGKSNFTRDLRFNRVWNPGFPHRKEYVQWSRVVLSEHGAFVSRNFRGCIDFLQETAVFPHVKVNSAGYCLSA